jgi:hypothetical protein
MKKILLLILLLFFGENKVYSADLGNLGTINATVGAASQKYSRGFVSNRNQPTSFLYLDYVSPAGFYINSALTYDKSDSGSYSNEWCNTPGYKNRIDKITINLSYQLCEYQTVTQYGYYQIKLNGEATKLTNIFFNYYIDDTGSSYNSTRTQSYAGNGKEFGLTHNLGIATATLRSFIWDNYSTTYSVGASKLIYDVNFDLFYHQTKLEDWNSAASKSASDRGHLILTVKKIF